MFVLPHTRDIIDVLSEGRLIRSAVAWMLRILALLIVLGTIYLLIELLKASFRLETKGTIGGLLFTVIFLIGAFLVSQVFLYRAEAVLELGDSSFTVIPIISLLFRTAGEATAVIGVTSGLGGCLFIWFSGMNPLALAPGLAGLFFTGGGETFVDGLLMLILSIVLSFLILVVFYFLAEVVVAIADIARNVGLLVRAAPAPVRAAVAPSPRPVAATPSPPARAAAARCPRCGLSLTTDDLFCGNCGASVSPSV